MINLTQYLTSGPQGTLALKAGTNFSYKGDQLQVFDNTEVDRWFVGAFSSANYFITVEFNSNQKETLQVLVVARPDHASFTVYGRTSVDNQLVTISAEVNSSWLSLRASPADPVYAGARICLFATYAETMLPLQVPTAITQVDPGGGGSGGSGGGSGGGSATYSFGVIGVNGQSDVTADIAEDKLNFVAGDGIVLTTLPTSNSLRIASVSTGFSSVIVPGQATLQSVNQAGALRIQGSGNVAVTTNSATNTITLSTASTLPSLTVSGNSTLNTITASGAISTTSTLSATGLTTLNNLLVTGDLTVSGTSTIINSSSLEVADLSITVAKNANTGLQANGAGLLIQGAGAELKWNNGDSALTVNKNLLPEFGNNLNLGSSSKPWQTVYAQSITGSLGSPSQTNITAVGALDSLTVVGNITGNGNLSIANITSSGLINITSSAEAVIDVTSSSSVFYNFAQGAIFYHSTAPSIDWAATFGNLPTTNGRAISVNIIVPQGTTPYKITSCTIDGVVQTISWAGATVPSGTASKTDIWAFTFIRRNNSWNVLASVSSNFG